MVVRALSLDVRPIACTCKKSYDKVITRAILSHPRTTLACSRAPAAYWRTTVRKILCVCFVQRSLSDASDRACSVRPYFYLRLFVRMHSDQTEFCVSYDFLIASSRAPIVKAPLNKPANILVLCHAFYSYSASHDNWCTVTLWNRIMTAQCEGMGSRVGEVRAGTTSPMPEHNGFML